MYDYRLVVRVVGSYYESALAFQMVLQYFEESSCCPTTPNAITLLC